MGQWVVVEWCGVPDGREVWEMCQESRVVDWFLRAVALDWLVCLSEDDRSVLEVVARGIFVWYHR